MNKITKTILTAAIFCGTLVFSINVRATGLDISAIDNTLKEDIVVNYTERQYKDKEDEILKDVKAKIKTKFSTKGIVIDENIYNINVSKAFVPQVYDIAKIYKYKVNIKEKSGNKETKYQKDISIKYNNTSSSHSAEKQALQEKLWYDTQNGFSYSDLSVVDPILDLTTADPNTIEEKSFRLNKQTFSEFIGPEYEIVQYEFSNGGNGDYQGIRFPIQTTLSYEIYKNNVLYAIGEHIKGVIPGNVIGDNKDVVLTFEKIDNNSQDYKIMSQKASAKDFKEVVSAYNIKKVKLFGSTFTGKIPVEFTVDQKYNGKKILVIHRKNDSTFEEFEVLVNSSKVKVEVDNLSPFMLATKKDSGSSHGHSNTYTPPSIHFPNVNVNPGKQGQSKNKDAKDAKSTKDVNKGKILDNTQKEPKKSPNLKAPDTSIGEEKNSVNFVYNILLISSFASIVFCLIVMSTKK